jgi:hypothetical protein
VNPAFFKQGAAAQSGKASGIAGVMKRARQSGRLQMSSQGLKAIPPEVFMLDDTVTEDEKCVARGCACAINVDSGWETGPHRIALMPWLLGVIRGKLVGGWVWVGVGWRGWGRRRLAACRL